MVLAVERPFRATLTQCTLGSFMLILPNPTNSTFGLGADHTPNAEITVNPFVKHGPLRLMILCPSRNIGKTGYLGRQDHDAGCLSEPQWERNRCGRTRPQCLNFPNGPTVVLV